MKHEKAVFSGSLFDGARNYGAWVQVLGLRTASTTSRIAAMTCSGWSWAMLCPLPVANTCGAVGTSSTK